jgi:putative hydrolase of the HAD superfamily
VKAVIFDYFGTLTVATEASTRRAGAERVAVALGVDPSQFFQTITSTFTERSTGRAGDMRQTMAWVAERCGGQPSAAQLDAACAVRRTVEATYARKTRPDAAATLRLLRERGLRIGVISDCTHELPELWSDLAVAPWVDATVFSVVVGERKPHPSLYRSVCAQLGVPLDEVVYVGDGGSNELTGARSLGIPAVRLVADDGIAALVYDPESEWTGPVISRLSELTTRSLAAVFGLPGGGETQPLDPEPTTGSPGGDHSGHIEQVGPLM